VIVALVQLLEGHGDNKTQVRLYHFLVSFFVALRNAAA
jgi:hypothetical protein